MEQLTHHKNKLIRFHYRNGGIIFSVSVPPDLADITPTYPLEPVRRNADGTVQSSRWPYPNAQTVTYVARGQSQPHALEGKVDRWKISPDGRRAVARQLRRGLGPPRWLTIELETGHTLPAASVESSLETAAQRSRDKVLVELQQSANDPPPLLLQRLTPSITAASGPRVRHLLS